MTAGKDAFFTKTTPFILIHALVWWLMTIAAKTVLDGYGDMAEVYAWSQHWLLGSDKHPQFLPWMAKFWFLVAPQSVASFYLLSAVNLAVALFGIRALARGLNFEDRHIAVALALCALALPYLTLTSKLNMNSICLATWPWAAWAFVRATAPQASRRNLYAVLFGMLAAVSILGKYYSVVLLIPLFASTFTPARRYLWLTAVPWLAFIAFVLVLSPHLYWLVQHREALAYAGEQGGSGGLKEAVYYIAKFAVSPFFYWPIPLVLAALFLVTGSPLQRLAKLLKRPAGDSMLAFLAMGPWLTTLGFAVAGLAVLSTPWAIPIGFAFTLYLVRNADQPALDVNGPKIVAAFRFIWPLMIIGGIVSGVMASTKGNVEQYTPWKEGANAIVETWKNEHVQPLRWIAKGNDAASLAFLFPETIEALPALPDRLPGYYPPRADWRNEAGVVVCSLALPGKVKTACITEATTWAAENGLKAESKVLTVHRSGVRFPKQIDFELAVVYIRPE